MAKRPNYLLGYGERLAEPVEIKSGGGEKPPPYPFKEARERLGRMLSTTVQALQGLPDSACPEGQAVASFTLHPEYFAKSYHPGGFFRDAGLRAVGSRPARIEPERRSRGRQPEETVSTEYFVAGARSAFERLAESLPHRPETRALVAQLAAIERIAAVPPEDRVRRLPESEEAIPLEIVLHAGETHRDQFIIRGFQEYMEEQGLEPDLERLFFAGRLCFLRMYAPPDQATEIAKFAFLRVLREMPRLRTTTPILRGKHHRPRAAELPAGDALDPNLRVAVFDGGLPRKSRLLAWADAFEAPGVGAPDNELLWHGETVTSALLFGSADAVKIERPMCRVDHYRVLDKNSEKDPFELYEVLERIETVLASKPYEFVSLSLGPTLPVDDDDVHAWTAVLDEKLAEGRCLTTIAAGNTGTDPPDPVLQTWRVQVPSDCVNGLTVGATDRRGGEWNRSPYSSRGPGRSPGIVKPDLVTFGGSDAEPFWVFDPDAPGRIIATAGTSYAAPAAMHAGAGVRARFGQVLSPLAIKALLIHGTDDGGHPRDEVGWGRLPASVDDLTVCPDGCVRIVYQDEITAAKYRRIRIPLPAEGLTGSVEITATFCFATEVDPEHPGNYTRSGLSIYFRPDMTKFSREEAVHPDTAPFFQPANLYSAEQELRTDAHKWETCLHMRKRKRASGLHEPVFDIHYNARSEGHNDTEPRRIRYALVITVEAPRVKDLYDRVVRAYRAKLQPLNPVIEVPVRT
jgi:hypothetical protein